MSHVAGESVPTGATLLLGMVELPLLARSFRETVRSPLRWTAAVLAGLVLAKVGARADAVAIAMTVMAGLGAGYAASRLIPDEQAGQTLDALATTPIAPLFVGLQNGAGLAAGWLAFSIVPVLMCELATPRGALETWLRGAAVVLVTGWGCSPGTTLRVPGGRLRRFGWHATFLATAFLEFAALLCVMSVSLHALVQACTVILIGLAAEWCSVALVARAGVHWPEDYCEPEAPPRAVPGRAGEGGRGGWFAPIPDGVPGPLWREAQDGLRRVLFIGLASGLLAASLLTVQFGRNVLEACLGAMPQLIVLGAVITSCVAAGRTERDRRSGALRDLAVTPISPASVVAARVGGVLVLAFLASAPSLCVLSYASATSGSAAPAPLIVWVLLAGVAWTAAVLAGIMGGSAGAGLMAKVEGLVLLIVATLGMLVGPCLLAGPHSGAFGILLATGWVLGLIWQMGRACVALIRGAMRSDSP